VCCLFHRTGTISAGDYLLAVGDVWLDNHSLDQAAHVLTVTDKVVKLRIQKNECYTGNVKQVTIYGQCSSRRGTHGPVAFFLYTVLELLTVIFHGCPSQAWIQDSVVQDLEQDPDS